MLTIRSEQIEVFRAVLIDPRSENLLIAHLRRHFAREWREIGEAGMQSVVKDGMRRAAGWGFRTTRERCLFISLMLLLGSHFDNDPQLPWARMLLAQDPEGHPWQRIVKLYDTTVEYLETTAGTENEALVRALLRVRARDLREPLPGDGRPMEKLGDLCASLYPEKWRFQGAAATASMIREAITTAAYYGAEEPFGQAVFVVSAFMMGSGFDRDPQYPWAAEALTGDLEVAGTLRARQLWSAGLDHIEHSLAPDRPWSESL